MTTDGDSSGLLVPRSKVRARNSPGIERPRLVAALDELWNRQVAVVVAPAGSGKTTLLSQFAAQAAGRSVPVAWYHADTADTSLELLLAGLGTSVDLADGGPGRPWSSIADAARWLDGRGDRPLLIVVDDLHEITGTPGEDALGRLTAYLPPGVRVLLASRRTPSVNLSRLRLAGELVEVDADDLRFRSWEVEQLFRDFYRAPLPPEDMAQLARTTDGWAAGLQLFHLATQGKSGRDRRRLLRDLGSRSSLVREYLTRNMLDDLTPALRHFLLETCLLGRLSPAICNRYLGVTGSAAQLAELERLQLFTQRLDDDDYRYHEVLRTHLEAMLAEQVGPSGVRDRYRKAGQVLEESGALADALRAYVCAEDAQAAGRLLGRRGAELSAGPTSWLDLLPSPLVDHDPWVRLVQARKLTMAGRPIEALAAYAQAEHAFGAAPGRVVCERERARLAQWIHAERVSPDPGDWLSLLRSATQRHPDAVRVACLQTGQDLARFSAGMAAALDGNLATAANLLDEALAHDPLSPLQLAVARLVAGVVAALGGDEPGLRELAAVRSDADRRGATWLSRLAGAVLVVLPCAAAAGMAPDGRPLEESALGHGDEWGAAVLAFSLGLRALLAADAPAGADDAVTPAEAADAATHLEIATARFRALAAPVAEAWALSVRALLLARSGDAEAETAARAAVSVAVAAGTRWPLAAAHLALSLAAGAAGRSADAESFRDAAAALAVQLGARFPELDAPTVPGPSSPDVRGTVRAVAPRATVADEAASAADTWPFEVRCLGEFTLRRDGVPVDLTALKPRSRAVLRLLASRAGQWVHREELIVALWPDADVVAGARNLHVALSSVRQVLEPGVARGASTLLPRSEDSYMLAPGVDAVVDHVELVREAKRARDRQVAGDAAGAADSLRRALAWYGGDLLPIDGQAEWVVKDRERLRMEAADVAHRLAELLVADGQHREAVAVAERGVQIDRYRDGLWLLLIATLEEAGGPAEAEQARRRYHDLLAELGV